MSSKSDIPTRIREVIDASGLTIDLFADSIGETPDRVKNVLGGKQRAPADMLVTLASLPGVDIQYVLTGFHFDEVRNEIKAKAAYDSGVAFVANLFTARKLPRDPAMVNAIAGIDMAAEGDTRVRGGLSNLATALQTWEPKRARKTQETVVEGSQQHFHGAVGNVAGRDIVNHAPSTRTRKK